MDKKGMTLIELLIVLGLMAALAGMTLSTVTDMDERARGNVTRERLASIRAAVMGDPGGGPGFLRDMGRLPRQDFGRDEGEELAELWDWNRDRDYSRYRTRQPDSDPLTLSSAPTASAFAIDSGWRGPYLPPPRGGKLFDGFGRNFTLPDPADIWIWKVTGQTGADDGQTESVVLLPRPEEGNPEPLASSIHVYAYLHHYTGHPYIKAVQDEEESGGGEPEGEEEESGEESGEDDDNAGESVSWQRRNIPYIEGEWRIAAPDKWNDVDLTYVLFIPRPDEAGQAAVVYPVPDTDKLPGEWEISRYEGDPIYAAQAKLYVCATVTRLAPRSEEEWLSDGPPAEEDPDASRFLDCGDPILLPLRPGINHVDVYLREKRMPHGS